MYQVSEHTKLNGTADFDAMARGREISTVYLWDCGPEKPVAPKRPDVPKGTDGDPEYEVAKVEFKDLLETYERQIREYARAKVEFEKWQSDYGGPIERRFWSCDAQDAMARDQRAVAESRQKEPRYYISTRTRGYERKHNLGLPKGVKPGHGQAAQEERERQGIADLERAARADPVFGQPQPQETYP